MKKVPENIKERLRKIANLAERGYKAEAQVARRLLEQEMSRYGISFEDLADDKQIYREIAIKDYDSLTLAYAVIAKHVGLDRLRESDLYKRKNSRKYVIGLGLTNVEYIDIVSLYEFHLRCFMKEKRRILKMLLPAYVRKNDLAIHANDVESCESSMTNEDLETLYNLVCAVKKETYFKQIEHI